MSGFDQQIVKNIMDIFLVYVCSLSASELCRIEDAVEAGHKACAIAPGRWPAGDRQGAACCGHGCWGGAGRLRKWSLSSRSRQVVHPTADLGKRFHKSHWAP